MAINKEYVPIDNQPTIKPKTVTGIFTRYIAKTLPLAFDESMSYYECLCALLEYINTKVVPTLDNNAAGLLELQEFYEELQSYVNDYFKNLDVQEEINNKLDEMAESGQLTDIIAQYLGLAGMIAFNTVADMKKAENLVNGSKCETLGYHSVNDGGKAIYLVRYITNSDTVDEGALIALHDQNLVAELMEKDKVTPEMFGAYGDGVHDDYQAIQNAIDYINGGIVELQSKTYIVGNTLTIHRGVKLTGLASYDNTNSTLKLKDNTNKPILQSMGTAGLGATHFIIIENIRIHGNYDNQTQEINLVDIRGSFVGTIIRNCQICDYYGTAIHIQGCDMQIDNLWVINGYTLTGRYAFDTNQKFTTERNSMINANNLYIENYRNTKGGNPQTTPTIREHALRINKVAGFNGNELHFENSGKSITIQSAWNVHLNMVSSAFCGNTNDNDNALIYLYSEPLQLYVSNLYLTTECNFTYWLKKDSSITNYNYKNIVRDTNYPYLPLIIGTLANYSNSTINNPILLNNAIIERIGGSSTNLTLKCSSGETKFKQNGAYYNEITSSMNQPGGNEKVFQRFNSSGNSSDLISFFTPIMLGVRNTAGGVEKDSLYMYKNGTDNFPVYQRVTGTNDGMNKITTTRVKSTPPNVNAMYTGEMWLDITNKKLYVATAIGSSTASDDWTILN